MSAIKPAKVYVHAMQAVNLANKPRMAYTALAPYETGRFSGVAKAGYNVVRHGFLTQIAEGIRRLV